MASAIANSAPGQRRSVATRAPLGSATSNSRARLIECAIATIVPSASAASMRTLGMSRPDRRLATISATPPSPSCTTKSAGMVSRFRVTTRCAVVTAPPAPWTASPTVAPLASSTVYVRVRRATPSADARTVS